MRGGFQPAVVGLAGEAVARHRRDDDVERVRRGAAKSGRIGQRLDDLQLLDDRAGPAVGDDDRQRILVLRADVDEVDVEPVDFGDEIREGVQPRLDLAPVVFGRPIIGELLHRRELHALRVVVDRLAIGPSGRGNPPAEILELFARRVKLERPDRRIIGRRRGADDEGFGLSVAGFMVARRAQEGSRRRRLPSYRTSSFSRCEGGTRTTRKIGRGECCCARHAATVGMRPPRRVGQSRRKNSMPVRDSCSPHRLMTLNP